MKHRFSTRIFCSFLTLLMLVQTVPETAFADEIPESSPIVSIEENEYETSADTLQSAVDEEDVAGGQITEEPVNKEPVVTDPIDEKENSDDQTINETAGEKQNAGENDRDELTLEDEEGDSLQGDPEYIASGTTNNVTWSIDSTGFLLVEGTGDYERIGYGYSPWHDNVNDIKSAKIRLSGATDLSYMLSDCEYLLSVDLTELDTSTVTKMYGMFDDCLSLSSLDLSGLDTSSVTDMSWMFYECRDLEKINFSGFDTSAVTTMQKMFYACGSLESLDVSGFDTSSVTDMSYMFYMCSSLKSLDVSSFDTSSVTNMAEMFASCNWITSLNISGFDTSSVTNMYGMFEGTRRLESLDLSCFDTSSVESMFHMFWDTQIRVLDLSNFDMSNVAKGFVPREVPGGDYEFVSYWSHQMIKTPKNLTTLVMFGNPWYDLYGGEYTELPQNLDHSITLIKNRNGDSNYKYSNGTLTISGVGPIAETDDYPWSHQLQKVDRIVIEEGIMSLPKNCFKGLNDYTSIEIPQTMTSIASSALGENGNSLATIHYSGDESQWDKISGNIAGIMKKNSIAVHFKGTNRYKGYFRYVRFKENKKTAPHQYECDLDWFFRTPNVGDDNSNYNHALAVTSLDVAMAAFAPTKSSYDDEENPSEYGSQNIRSMMNALEFSYDDESIHYEPSRTKDDYDNIGFAIGSRTIRDDGDGEEASLILVAVRGAGYQAEWGGNLHVGTGGSTSSNHEGFDIASEKVIKNLKRYLKSNSEQLKEKKKVWLVGFSRAAAVANLTAAKLDYGEINGITDDDVFAFCFECPQNTAVSKSIASHSTYRNIVNIVNPIDLVPKVAMTGKSGTKSAALWGFKRYGVTYEFTSFINHTRHLSGYDKMCHQLEQILNEQDLSPDDYYRAQDALCCEFTNQEYIFNSVVDGLADIIGSRVTYKTKLEKNFMDLVVKKMATSVAENIKIDKLSLPPSVGSVLELLIYKAFDWKYGSSGLVKFKAWMKVVGSENPSFKDLFMDMVNAAHAPELCLAWMESYSGDVKDLLIDKGYRLVFVNCPVDVTVKDGSGNVIGQITDDEPQQIDGGVSTFIDQHGQKTVILPMDADYSIDITGTDDGSVTYTVADIPSETGSAERLVCYEDVPIEKGDTLSAVVEETITDPADYTLMQEDSTPIAATFDLSGEELEYRTISVTSNGNGNADPGGAYLPGQYVKLIATPDEQAVFLGWYDKDGNLLCPDEEYRFEIKRGSEDIELIAEFSDDTSQVYTTLFNAMGGTGDAVVKDIARNSYITLPEDPVKEGYTFMGWFTERNGQGTKITDKIKVRDNCVFYAYWLKDGCTITFATDKFAYYSEVAASVTDIAPVAVTGGSTYQFADPDPIEDYIFGGWFTGQDGTGDRYTDSTIINDDVTLYPYWRHTGFSVSPVEDQVYTGKAIKPEIKVYDGTTLLAAGKDYKISKYINNTNVADRGSTKPPSITVIGTGNYSGSETVTFSIIAKDLADEDVIADNIVLKYNKGKKLTVKPVIKYNGKTLASNKDYTFEIFKYDVDESGKVLETFTKVDTVTDEGSYKITASATAKSCYTGTRDISLTVTTVDPIKISGAAISKIPNQPYTGDEIQPDFTVKIKNRLLTGDDYSVTYSDNTEIGTAKVTITGNEAAGYTGSKSVTFKITGTSITGATVTNADGTKLTSSYVYSGSYIRPLLKVVLKKGKAETLLNKGSDYTVSYTNNKEIGTATMIITGKGYYFGTIKKTFTIQPYSLKTDTDGLIAVNGAPVENGVALFTPENVISLPYVKGGVTVPSLTVTYNGRVLKQGEDYTVSYKNNSKVADCLAKSAPTVTIKGKGRFKDSVAVKYTITAQSLENVTMTADDSAFSPKKKGFYTKIALTDHGKVLVLKTDYENVVYSYTAETENVSDGKTVVTRHAGDVVADTDIVPVGTVLKVTVTGKGGYGAAEGNTKSAEYTVRKESIAKAKITIPTQYYTGKEITLDENSITVNLNKTDLVLGKDYVIVSYSDNVKQSSKAKVFIKGIGNYSGNLSKAFTIKKRIFKWWWSQP